MISGQMFYEAFHAALPSVTAKPWDELHDWQRRLWSRAARILEERLHNEL